MLKVYGFSRVNKVARGNTRDLRVLWALEEMGLPYDIVGMDHPNHDLDTPAYRALNPFGQIPAIDDDGVVVTESGAILLYLARKSGKLMPRDLAGEAQVLRWSVAALNTIEVPVLTLWFVNMNDGKGTKASDALRHWSEQRLKQARWLARGTRLRCDRRVHRRGHPDDARPRWRHGAESLEALPECSRVPEALYGAPRLEEDAPQYQTLPPRPPRRAAAAVVATLDDVDRFAGGGRKLA